MGYPDMMRDILAQARGDRIASLRKAIESLPIIDRLTGLYNKEYFELRLDEEMARSRLCGNRLSLIFIATGLFLRQDQGYEDPVHEKTMRVIAEIIGDSLTDTIGLAFYYDQGKFTVIMPEEDEQKAALITDHIRMRIIEEKIQGMSLHTAVIQYRNHESIDELIQAADAALHGNARE